VHASVASTHLSVASDRSTGPNHHHHHHQYPGGHGGYPTWPSSSSALLQLCSGQQDATQFMTQANGGRWAVGRPKCQMALAKDKVAGGKAAAGADSSTRRILAALSTCRCLDVMQIEVMGPSTGRRHDPPHTPPPPLSSQRRKDQIIKDESQQKIVH
jgi:hypothetical protein